MTYPQFGPTLSDQFDGVPPPAAIRQTASAESVIQIGQTASDEFAPATPSRGSATRETPSPLPAERRFERKST